MFKPAVTLPMPASPGNPTTPKAPLLLDKYRQKFGLRNGGSRGTQAASDRQHQHLAKALEEIDGLLVGFQCLDKQQAAALDTASVSSYTPPVPFEGDLPSRPAQLDLDMDHGSPVDHASPGATAEASSSDPEEPLAREWAAIRTLREETEFHHKRFRALTKDSNDPILAELCSVYQDAKAVRTRGVETFRRILEGSIPFTLSKVFPFASLSYAISKLLVKCGRLEQGDVLSGLQLWRNAISDADEREAFGRLAIDLWPEARDHIHCIPIVQIPAHLSDRFPCLSDDIGKDDDGWQWPSRGANASRAGMGQSHWIDDALFSDPLAPDLLVQTDDVSDLPLESHMYTENPQQAFFNGVMNMTYLTSREFNFGALCPMSDHPSYAGDWSGRPPEQVNTSSHEDPPGFTLPHHPLSGPMEGTVKGKPDTTDLQSTALYLAFFLFLRDNKEALRILAGRRFMLRSKKSDDEEAAKEDQEIFFALAKNSFFKPRRSTAISTSFTALLSVAENYTRIGYLQTVEDIKYYLYSAALVCFASISIRSRFLSSL